MNATHAFITSFTCRHNNQDHQLNVRYLNDVFFGVRLEQRQLHQYAGTGRPVFLTQHAHEPLPVPDEDETM